MNSKKKYKTSPQKRARDRGRANEGRTAKIVGGHVYVGKNGDVVDDEDIYECKYRTDLKLTKCTELADFIEQARRNAEWWNKQGDPKNWVVQISGGRKWPSYSLIPTKRYVTMKKRLRELEAKQ